MSGRRNIARRRIIMKRFMYISGSIMCLVITLAIGIYIGGQLAQAKPPPQQEPPVWCDCGMDASGQEIIKPKNEAGQQVPIDELSKGVPVEWLLYQATYLASKGEKYMKVYVTVEESRSEEYLHPGKYNLYFEGWDPEHQKFRCLDRVPIWP
jgi:hypothetical protein